MPGRAKPTQARNVMLMCVEERPAKPYAESA